MTHINARPNPLWHKENKQGDEAASILGEEIYVKALLSFALNSDGSSRKMHPYPHVYTAAASGRPEGAVAVTSPRLPEITTAPPLEFGGSGDEWSPETLHCASVADCFVLSFRAIARASKLDWSELACRVEGVLERVDGVTQFTRYTTFASLKVSSESVADKARRLLEKAEQVCLISNSLCGKHTLVIEIVAAD